MRSVGLNISCCSQGVVLLVACLALPGCGGVYDATLSGSVTLDDKPLDRGTITFRPVSPGPPSIARIESDGSYRVNTGSEEGLPSGSYSVTVKANEPPASAMSEDGGPPPPGKRITPRWYEQTKTSPLKVEVKPGHNDYPLALDSTPPEGWVEPKKRNRR